MAKRVVIILIIASVISIFGYAYAASYSIVNDLSDNIIIYTIIAIPLSLFFITHETIKEKRVITKIVIFCISCITIVIYCYAFFFAFFIISIVTGLYRG